MMELFEKAPWLGRMIDKVQMAGRKAATASAAKGQRVAGLVPKPNSTYKPKADFDQFELAVKQALSPALSGILGQLQAYYNQAMADAHLLSVTQQRRLALMGRPFQLLDGKGRQHKAAQFLFDGPWFHRWLELAFDQVLYGFTVMRIGPPEAGSLQPLVDSLPREAINSWQRQLLLDDGHWVSFDSEGFRPFIIPLGQPADLGLLRQAVPLVLWKQGAIRHWSRHLELFGMPFRKGHTDISDPDMRDRMSEMLRQMGAAGWGVFDQSDRVEFVESKAGGNHSTYEALARFADEQISKLVLGQTMTTDTGSSLAQAQVHERVGQSFFRADARRVESDVNSGLMPRLEEMGLPVSGARFRFLPDEDSLRPELKMDLVKALLPYMRIPAAWLESEFGIKVEEVEK
jgi:hypothetical protein